MMKIFFTTVLTLAALAGTMPAAQAAGNSGEPRWDKAVTTTHAKLLQTFMLDGIIVRIDRIAYVDRYPDGTGPDEGARIVEIEYWAHNPEPTNADFYERFYAYAQMSDGTDTDGEGLSYFPLDSGKEFEDVTLKPGMTVHARFFVELPAAPTLSKLVIFGPIDGAKVALSPPATAK